MLCVRCGLPFVVNEYVMYLASGWYHTFAASCVDRLRAELAGVREQLRLAVGERPDAPFYTGHNHTQGTAFSATCPACVKMRDELREAQHANSAQGEE